MPWLWKGLDRVGPHPYRSRGGLTRDLLSAHRIRSFSTKVAKTRLTIPPTRLYNASMGYDSFSPLLNPLAAGLGVTAKDIKAGLASANDKDYEFIDFGDDPDQVDATEFASENLRQELERENIYTNARYGAFLNALYFALANSPLNTGSLTLSWAAEQATNIVEDHERDPWVKAVTDSYGQLAHPPKELPLRFTESDAKRYLEQFCGERLRSEFRAPTFLDQVDRERDSQHAGHNH